MLFDIPPAWASLLLVAFLISSVIFVANIHLSTTRLCLLLGVSIVSGALSPAVSSILGPGPGTSSTGELVYGSDGKLMYSTQSLHYWSTVTATQDAIMILGGFVGGIAFLLLIYRMIACYIENVTLLIDKYSEPASRSNPCPFGAFGKDMRAFLLLLLFYICACSLAHAGGSISWDEVRNRICKSDTELVKCIEAHFKVNRVGGGMRLGHQFGDQVGTRIPPYDFDAILISTGDKYHLEISESDDFEFTGRYKFVWQVLSQK